MVYVLQHNKKDMELIIRNWDANAIPQEVSQIKEGLFYWNEKRALSESRDILRTYAKELKEEWLQEAINRVAEQD